ncbi:MAG: response regulator [Planctomycetes bacterium]|nr:response regulator [Planctomycetota bacterium]
MSVSVPVSASASASTAASGPRRRLLVIDDEALIVQVVSQYLAPGHDVVAASDAAQALALLLVDDAPRFDAILCDLHLPGMTGAELHARIARERPGLERHFVFMTGGALNPGSQQFLESCANRVLDKPFELSEVARACLDPERGRSLA